MNQVVLELRGVRLASKVTSQNLQFSEKDVTISFKYNILASKRISHVIGYELKITHIFFHFSMQY